MQSTLQTHIHDFIATLDQRIHLVDVESDMHDHHVVLTGTVLTSQHHAHLLELVRQHAPELQLHDRVVILQNHAHHGWATVQWAVADVRQAPGRTHEMVTQATYGEGVEVFLLQDDWYFVQTADGYLGWISKHGLVLHDQPASFRTDATHVIQRPFQAISGLEGQQLNLLTWGTLLPVDEFRDGCAYWMGPDGQPCQIPADALMPIDDRPEPTLQGCQDTLQFIFHLIGIPYLWGGTTTFGFDCSGLVQAYYAWMNTPLLRDADQQRAFGQEVARNEIQAGDLLFWAVHHANQRTENINHVAIALDNTLMIHANQRRWSISIDPIDQIQQHFAEQQHPGLIAIKRLAE